MFSTAQNAVMYDHSPWCKVLRANHTCISLCVVQNYRHCSISSQDIELQYQQDPTSLIMFSAKSFSYELDLYGELHSTEIVSFYFTILILDVEISGDNVSHSHDPEKPVH